MVRSSLFGKTIVIVLFSSIIACTVYLGVKLYRNAKIANNYKEDFFVVNQLKYGLLNGESWSWQVERIIIKQIDSLTFTPQNRKVMQAQIEKVMNRLLTEVDKIIHTKQGTLKKNIQYKVLNSLVDIDDFRKDVPHLSETLLDELDRSKNRASVKKLLKDKVNGILNANDEFFVPDREGYFKAYNVKGLFQFNEKIQSLTAKLEMEQKILGYMLISLMGLTLLIWIWIIRKKYFQLFAYAFLFSVIISFVNLFVGISLPMIDIDARISEVNLQLLKSNIYFYDQIIFYKSKSILDVVLTLLTNGKIDTIIVGILILSFSILFPVGKLISATWYLFTQTKNKLIKMMAFKSGKWSMADVMVVAIFMAYIGFQGILNDQLQHVNITSKSVNLLSTNKSNLQIGFVIFVAFVMFNLFLSSILKRITQSDVLEAEAIVKQEILGETGEEESSLPKE